jgi:hypothetical protein
MYNHEVKGTLAKLLATENLIVEHKNVSTASFDVERRVLVLPNWQRASNTVYDLLVGHEVGHALYTPNSDWNLEKECIPKDYVNVIEDARIEKMMKRKYPGFSKTFYRGYQELSDDDFFSVKDEDLDKMMLIDRINLHFKIGAFSLIEFNEEEKQFVDRTEQAETFEEVKQIALDVFNYTKSNKDKVSINIDLDLELTTESGGSTLSSIQVEDGNEAFPSSENKEENTGAASGPIGSTDEGKPDETNDKDGDKGGDDYTSATNKSFEEKQKELSNTSFHDSIYVEVPDVNLENIVVDHKIITNHCNSYYSELGNNPYSNYLDHFDKEYSKFYKESIKGVNYLVKEFECKKSADAYSRSSTARTGILDTSKLHTYKFNEDLFKKVNVIPDGKNHGLIFVVDWSGSMQDTIIPTVQQLLNLVWFCKKVQIPFEVYAFTYEFSAIYKSILGIDPDHSYEMQKKKPGDLVVHESFNLLNLISHRATSQNFDLQCKNIWRIAYSEGKRFGVNPSGMGLSGTPLNETIITLKKMIPNFIKDNNVQKTNVVILTDGESAGVARYTMVKRWDRPEEEKIGLAGVHINCCLRDRKIGHVYKEFSNEIGLTTTLLQNIKDNYPNVNLIGFRILPSRDVSNFYWSYLPCDNYDQYRKVWNKEKSYIVFNKGYDVLYALSGSQLNQSDEFQVAEDATNAQIKSAFQKSLKSKSINKRILSSFVSVVA